MLAANCAGDAAFAGFGTRGAELLMRQTGHFLKCSALKVTRGQRSKAVEGEQVGGGAEFAVFFSRRSEGTPRKRAAQFGELAGMCPFSEVGAAQRDGLDVF